MTKRREQAFVREPTQLDMFAEAVQPTTYRDEIDDRYDAAILDGCPRGMLALIAGAAQVPGVAEQADAVKELSELGFDDKEIAKATKLHVARIELVRRFEHLPVALQGAVRSGEVSSRLAVRLLKLSPMERARVGDRYDENGKITEADVDAARRVTRDAAIEALPDALFEMPEPARDEESFQRAVRVMLETMTVEELRMEFERVLEQVEAHAG